MVTIDLQLHLMSVKGEESWLCNRMGELAVRKILTTLCQFYIQPINLRLWITIEYLKLLMDLAQKTFLKN